MADPTPRPRATYSKGRVAMLRQALRLVRAVAEATDGLGPDDVAEVLEVGKRTAYRWMEAADGDPDVLYELRPDSSSERAQAANGQRANRLYAVRRRARLARRGVLDEATDPRRTR